MSRDYQQYSQEWRPDEKQGIIMYMYFFSLFFWIQIKLWAFNLTSKPEQPLIWTAKMKKQLFFWNKDIENA